MGSSPKPVSQMVHAGETAIKLESQSFTERQTAKQRSEPLAKPTERRYPI